MARDKSRDRAKLADRVARQAAMRVAAGQDHPVLRRAAVVDVTLMLAEVHRIMEGSKVEILEEGTPQMLRSALEIVKKLVMAGMYQGWNLEVGVQLNRILAELGLRIPTEPCPKHRPGRRVSLPQSAARKRRRR